MFILLQNGTMLGKRRKPPIGRLQHKNIKTCDRLPIKHRCSKCIKGRNNFRISTSEDGTIKRIRFESRYDFERLAPCEKI